MRYMRCETPKNYSEAFKDFLKDNGICFKTENWCDKVLFEVLVNPEQESKIGAFLITL